MSKRFNNGSHYENHPRAAELHDAGEHAHSVAEQQPGKQDHLTGHEQSRLEAGRTEDGHHPNHETTVGHGVAAFGHDEIAALAHRLWEERGRPEGSPDDDWLHAVKTLRSRAIAGSAKSSFNG